MASEASISANRRNAAKSPGPTSKVGKKRASENALTLGAHSDRLLYGEDPKQFDQLKQKILSELKPVGFLEGEEAGRMISCKWRVGRLDRAEQHFLNQHVQQAAEERRFRWQDTAGEPNATSETCQIVGAEFSTLHVSARDTSEGLVTCFTSPDSVVAYKRITDARDRLERDYYRHFTVLRGLQEARLTLQTLPSQTSSHGD